PATRWSRAFLPAAPPQDIYPANEPARCTVTTILLIILVLILIGALPTWPHSRSWGYAPSSLLGIVVVVLLILLLMGRI
ncbi:MAG TPA: DUF3309 domain-containing protein, partial [Roseiflexaceae bacterium]|nr:DUF3309 domain-containing protein [Roseiflexaceae bacterium]